MEVHHFPQLDHRPKPWKEYFLEFLMIFFAVTLGFFAESYREGISNRSKENEYMVSLLEDLKSDTAFLSLSIHTLIPYHIAWMDSTEHLMEMPNLKGKDRLVYQAFLIATSWTYDFHPTQRTLSQLHTEGFHLIRNNEVASAISKLEDDYQLFAPANTLMQKMQVDIDVAGYEFADRNTTDQIDLVAYEDPLFIKLPLAAIPSSAHIHIENKQALKLYADNLRKYSFYLQTGIKADYTILEKEITETINIIQKEYGLQ